ncbi:MAG: aldehyde ferredoxin oxidoreductase N-terminal domain-containing protein [Candidatus Hodarchaeota archaeon]
MIFGNMGKCLKINLSTEEIMQESLEEDLYYKYLGGYGINNKLYYDYRVPNIDPFDPDSPIIIGVGALVGTKFPGSGKTVATYKSPIISKPRQRIHFIDNAVGGSFLFGRMLKRAGFDHLIITGKAKKPTTIKIFEDNLELLDANDVWGSLDLYETGFYYKDKFPNCGTIAIGKGGEKKVRYAISIIDNMATLGKFGFGAALGSKNIKSIISYGKNKIIIKEPDELTKLIKNLQESVKKIPILTQFKKWGINSGFDFQAPLINEGNFPFREWKKLYGLRNWKKVKGDFKIACNACLLNCRISFELRDGPYKGLKNYSGSILLPARSGNRLEITGEDRISKVVKLYEICNRAGICFFTATGLINWITRLYNSGKIDPDKINFELKREFPIYLKILEKILERSEIGDVLAEGWYATGEYFNADPDAFIEGVGFFKGSDAIQDGRFTTIDPQRFTYFTNPRPHHGGTQSIYTIPKMGLNVLKEDLLKMGVTKEEYNRVFTETPYYGPFNVGVYCKHAEDVMAIHNSLGSCIVYTLFSIISIQVLAPIYSAITGRKTTPIELKKIGERNFNFYKMLNIYEGFTSRNKCSKIWLIPRETPDGAFSLSNYYRSKELSSEEIENLLDDYYKERGWDSKSIPTKEKLKELGLDFLQLS